MKKLILLVFSLLLTTMSFALSKDSLNAVTMVSYEQSWLDSDGTLALRNNTNERIYNVAFLIKYLDMEGNELDYEEYECNIDIAPGMTKKVNIPAYEHRRYYHYYKTHDNYQDHPAFNIEYELLDYNSEDSNSISNKASDKSFSLSSIPKEAWLAILLVLFVISLSVGLYVLVAIVAQKRNRNPVVWLLLSFIASPFLIIIILLCLGEARDDKY